jgi:hypothetical protein
MDNMNMKTIACDPSSVIRALLMARRARLEMERDTWANVRAAWAAAQG